MGMKHTKVKNVYLANNRLTNHSLVHVINNINANIKELNLSNNKLEPDEGTTKARHQKLQ